MARRRLARVVGHTGGAGMRTRLGPGLDTDRRARAGAGTGTRGSPHTDRAPAPELDMGAAAAPAAATAAATAAEDAMVVAEVTPVARAPPGFTEAAPRVPGAAMDRSRGRVAKRALA
jgi:hypothetical protein